MGTAILDGKTEAEREAEAQALEAQAVRKNQDKADSFDRCDTDGFMSQWASGLGADKARLEADLVRAGGLMETRALFDLDGNLASTHNFQRKNQYSFTMDEVWRMNDEFVANGGKRFITLSEARKGATRYSNNAKKGVRVGTIRVRGYVDYMGANAVSVRAHTMPNVDDLKAGNFDIVTVDKGVGQDY